MNVISNGMKKAPTLVGSFLQTARGYAAVKKIPVEWIRPEKISCIKPEKSGDGGIDFGIKKTDFLVNYNKSKELENADEDVKRIFSIEFNKRSERIKLEKEKVVQLVRRHSHDTGSMETRIALITAEILQLQEHQEQFPYNTKSKVVLKEFIERRKKWLKKLRTQDYARFEFLLERLNLVYKPFPETNPYIYRKESTKKLLQKYCDDVVQKKLHNYKNELQSQQKDFYREKAEKLEFIRNEEIACGVTPTVTEEEVEAAKQKAASFG